MKNEKIDGKGEGRGGWSAEQIASLHGGSDLGREKSINTGSRTVWKSDRGENGETSVWIENDVRK